MQETRNELIAKAIKKRKNGWATKVDKQDILLGQLLDTAKDAVKDRFSEITMGKL